MIGIERKITFCKSTAFPFFAFLLTEVVSARQSFSCKRISKKDKKRVPRKQNCAGARFIFSLDIPQNIP